MSPLFFALRAARFKPAGAAERRKTARLVRQDWPVGQQHIWVHSARPRLSVLRGGVAASRGALCARLSH